MNNQTVTTKTINDVLNSCIQIEESRISRRITIPRQVDFHLSSEIINSIEQIILNKQILSLSATNLANLRYYTLISSSIEEALILNHPKQSIKPLFLKQSNLIFSTNYLSSTNQKTSIVVRSVIDLEGKISQQIQQDLWQNPQLLHKILDAHHWLILQILTQLPLNKSKKHLWLHQSFFLLVIFIISFAIWYLLPLNYFLKIVVICGILYILKICIHYLIQKQLKRWIIHHLIHGFLANKAHKRQIGFNILSYIL